MQQLYFIYCCQNYLFDYIVLVKLLLYPKKILLLSKIVHGSVQLIACEAPAMQVLYHLLRHEWDGPRGLKVVALAHGRWLHKARIWLVLVHLIARTEVWPIPTPKSKVAPLSRSLSYLLFQTISNSVIYSFTYPIFTCRRWDHARIWLVLVLVLGPCMHVVVEGCPLARGTACICILVAQIGSVHNNCSPELIAAQCSGSARVRIPVGACMHTRTHATVQRASCRRRRRDPFNSEFRRA